MPNELLELCDLTDAELIQLVQDRDEAAFAELMSRHKHRIWRVIVANSRHQQDAEEISNDIWMSVWQNIAGLRNVDSFGAWLYRIALNACRRYYKTTYHRVSETPQQESFLVEHIDQHATDRFYRTQLLNDIKEAVHQLPKKVRAVAELYYLESWNIREIAEKFKMPTGTVKSRLRDIRTLLRQEFGVETERGAVMSVDSIQLQDVTNWKLPDGAKARLGKGYPFDITYSKDGSLFAASGTIGVWLYDARTGKELNLFLGQTEGVGSVAISPDNSLLANDSEDNKITLRDLQTGDLKLTLLGHTDGVSTLTFSQDGQILFSGGDDELIHFWDVATGKQILTIAGHAGGVSEVVSSANGQFLASFGSDDMIHLWNGQTGEFLHTLTGNTGSVSSISISPDSKLLASGNRDGKIRIWDTGTGDLRKTINATTDADGVNAVVFSPDGKTFVSNNYNDDVIQFWDITKGERLKSIQSPPDTTAHLVFSPDGGTLANSQSDGTIRFWDVASGSPSRILDGYAQMFVFMTHSPVCSTLAVLDGDRRLRLWDTQTCEHLKTIHLYKQRVGCIAIAPDGIRLAYEDDRNNTINILNTETDEIEQTFVGHRNGITSVAFSFDGKTLAGGDSDGTIYLWDVTTGKNTKVLESKPLEIRNLVFSPDGQLLASSTDDAVRFWDLTTGDTIKKIQGHTVAPSPDLQTFLCINDSELQYWNVDGDEPIKIIDKKVSNVVYSPNGETFAYIHYEESRICFGDAHTGRVIGSFAHEHIEGVWFLCYSPDGRTLATAGWDSTVKLWDVPKPE